MAPRHCAKYLEIRLRKYGPKFRRKVINKGPSTGTTKGNQLRKPDQLFHELKHISLILDA
jgi:hypothetical protein